MGYTADLGSRCRTRAKVQFWHILLVSLTIIFLLTSCAPSAIENDDITHSEAQNHSTTPADTTHEGAVDGATDSNLIAQPEGEEESFLIIEEIAIGLLFLAVIVGIVTYQLRLPYTIGLVVLGLFLTLISPVDINISPTLILALLVPPLIFEAAFHLNINDLRNNLAPILALAVPGVVLTMLIVGGIVSWGTGLALPVAMVFGALVAATDPVSVVALFRTMGIPKRLQVLLEGESLFNDGTAIVLFDIVVIAAAVGTADFSLLEGVIDFIRVSGGGLILGILLGTAISQIISRVDDHLMETTLTTILAFGSFLIAEILGMSGVLAVVAAGLVNGNIGPRGMSPTTRVVVFSFWEYAAFLANTFIFLLIGLQIDIIILFENWQLIIWAIIAVLIARAIGVYGLSRVEKNIPLKWQHVMYWGGMRGAIALALAISLTELLPQYSNQIQVMTFAVVLFTLLFQGLTMKQLVSRLGLVVRREVQDEYERRHARAVAIRAANAHLDRRHRQGLISDHTWNILKPRLDEHTANLTEAAREVMSEDPEMEAEELDTARREALQAQRSTITSLLKDGVISEDNYALLVSEIDAAITKEEFGWPELFTRSGLYKVNVNRLMAVVIQQRDLENTFNALAKIDIPVTRLPSKGGYLGRENATLLIGLDEGQEAAVVKALNQSCRQRVEYLTTPVEGFPTAISTPVPVNVGGATIFTFEVERFEEF
jgi:CPA1 family monovalent cation:H+ antiporter